MRPALVAGLVLALTAATAYAQFGRGFFGTRIATAEDFDGRFNYCRLQYRPAFRGGGGSWTTDYPNADINMSVRLAELTRTRVSMNAEGDPNILVVRLSGEELF
jgi:hypothetical protein